MPRVLNAKTVDRLGHTVYVGRPTKFGNPFLIGTHGNREQVIVQYRRYLMRNPELVAAAKLELAGRDLVCWCAPLPCHADILLEIANGPEKAKAAEA